MIKFLGSLAGIVDKFMAGRRGRTRRKLNNLKRKKKKLLKKSCTIKIAKKMEKIDNKIKKLQEYLGEE